MLDREQTFVPAPILASKDAQTPRQNPSMEEYAIVSGASAIGCVGTLVVATRGDRGPGEVLVTVRGSKEALLAWSDEPLPKGATVLVVEVRGGRTVVVEPWKDLA
jgi:membrane protein implicated in regulation of membrane protease activity